MKQTDEAIVLVGGLGTRLRSVVADVPKPLAPVAGRPFLAWLLDALAARGMRRIVLATGYMAELVHDVVGTEWLGMTILHSVEPEPLGTGGAIAMARQHILGEAVHVLNGDTFHDYDPFALEVHTRSLSCPVGVSLARVGDVGRYGAAMIREGVVVEFSEKGKAGPGFINAGCYYLGRDALSGLGTGAFSFETTILAPAVARGQVAALCGTGRFIDIGVPEDFARAQDFFARP